MEKIWKKAIEDERTHPPMQKSIHGTDTNESVFVIVCAINQAGEKFTDTAVLTKDNGKVYWRVNPYSDFWERYELKDVIAWTEFPEFNHSDFNEYLLSNRQLTYTSKGRRIQIFKNMIKGGIIISTEDKDIGDDLFNMVSDYYFNKLPKNSKEEKIFMMNTPTLNLKK